MLNKRVFPLSKLTAAIENVINSHCDKVVWVKAEIVKLNHYPQTGHCYPDLVEKKNGRIVAEIRGNIWKSQFDVINKKFREVLQEDLKDDMTVVIQASITYHPVYGLALNILDIDPEYTLGELAKQKAETVKRLQNEGIFDANKKLQLAQLPKTIAVISIESSKGYQDFINVIEQNPWGYQYHQKLFPAVLQGDRAVKTIVAQLQRIKKLAANFEAVVIVRGGGGDIGLSCYDDYRLSKAIANFPIPVLTGIGHSTNETVSELVSYKSFITPTKIAEFFLQQFHNFAFPLKENSEKIRTLANRLFERQRSELSQISRTFGFLSGITLRKNQNRLEHFENSLRSCSRSILQDQKAELRNISNSVQLLSPKNILKRGYSITRKDGKIIKNADELKANEVVELEFYNGRATAEIEKIQVKKEDLWATK